MRNGSVAFGIGILVIGILAAEGKLQAIWTAIMHGTNAGETAQNLGSGTYPPTSPTGLISSPSGPIGQQIGTGVYDPNPITSPSVIANTPGPGERYPIPIIGSDAAFDYIYTHWPAGYDAAWEQFLGCYRQNGSITACQQWIHTDLPKG